MSNFSKYSVGYIGIAVGLSAAVEIVPAARQQELWFTKTTATASLYVSGLTTALGANGMGAADGINKLTDFRGSVFLTSVGATCVVDVLRFFTAGES